MNIQVITGNKILKNDDEITISQYSAVQALDDFDINIIDLSYRGLWFNNSSDAGELNNGNDLISIIKLINEATNSTVIYVYPQNIDYSYNYYYDRQYGKRVYHYTETIRDIINNRSSLERLNRYLIGKIGVIDGVSIICESTTTVINNRPYNANFHFISSKENQTLTKSSKSEKVTTIRYSETLCITTLDICNSNESIINYVNYLFGSDIDKDIPKWIAEYGFGSDKIEHQIIDENTKLIAEAQEKIDDAEKKLEINNKYKSILFTNGDRLVSVVFEILEIILECSLSDFEDKKKEDFLIIKDNIAIIGEIKGVSTNVKNEHVSQLEVHYQSYLDKTQNEEQEKDAYAVLIINPLRDSELKDREPINTAQIDLAVRNGSLIIETATLLKMLELYQDKKIATNDILNLIITKKGLLKIEDFNKQ